MFAVSPGVAPHTGSKLMLNLANSLDTEQGAHKKKLSKQCFVSWRVCKACLSAWRWAWKVYYIVNI